MAEIQWAILADIPGFSPVSGITMQLLAGDQMAMNLVTLAPHAEVPHHSHPNEQIGYVLSGTLILTIAGETHHVSAGMGYVVPGDVPHSGTTDANGCQVLDMFAPPRADYVEQQRQAIKSAG